MKVSIRRTDLCAFEPDYAAAHGARSLVVSIRRTDLCAFEQPHTWQARAADILFQSVERICVPSNMVLLMRLLSW